VARLLPRFALGVGGAAAGFLIGATLSGSLSPLWRGVLWTLFVAAGASCWSRSCAVR
jgi:hypothetical protein